MLRTSKTAPWSSCKFVKKDHALSEPAKSKCTWTSQKKSFMQEHTMNMPQTKTLKTPRLADFVRACAIEMHCFARIYSTNAAARERTLIFFNPILWRLKKETKAVWTPLWGDVRGKIGITQNWKTVIFHGRKRWSNKHEKMRFLMFRFTLIYTMNGDRYKHKWGNILYIYMYIYIYHKYISLLQWFGRLRFWTVETSHTTFYL